MTDLEKEKAFTKELSSYRSTIRTLDAEVTEKLTKEIKKLMGSGKILKVDVEGKYYRPDMVISFCSDKNVLNYSLMEGEKEIFAHSSATFGVYLFQIDVRCKINLLEDIYYNGHLYIKG